MAECKACRFFFAVPESADDFKPGKGDCVNERKDERGKYWIAKPAFETSESCESFAKKI